MWSRSSTEEVFYTIRDYENTAEDLGMRLPAYTKSFLTLINAGLRETVNNLIRYQSQGNFADIEEDLTAIPPIPAQTSWYQSSKELVANVSKDTQEDNLIQIFGDFKI